MQGYASAVSDLYREGPVYREERVLLRNLGSEREIAAGHSEALGSLLNSVPEGYGFYQARIAGPEVILEIMREKILPLAIKPSVVDRQAPQLVLTNGEVGSETDLETRIDSRSPRADDQRAISPDLRKQVENAGPLAFLEVQGTRRNSDGVLRTTPGLLVVAAARPWDLNAVQKAIRSQLAAGLSASELGLEWRPVNDAGGYFELDGLHDLQIATRDRLLYISTRSEMLVAALHPHAAPKKFLDLTYSAGFNHARERENFYELASILDATPEPKPLYGVEPPRFFSRNIGGLSRALSRLDSQEIQEREETGKVLQTVIYRWGSE